MKTENVTNSVIGVGGTVLAFVTPEKAAMFAGISTGAWMLWQLGAAVHDRFFRK